MGVIGYQIFIALSLLLVRVIAPKHLLMACYIWTGFTVLNLFYWPLIFLQLFVVWGMYGVISPGDDGGFGVEAKERKTPENLDVKPLPEMVKKGGFFQALEEVNNYASVALEVQKATLPIIGQVETEKTLIKAAISIWERKIAIDALNLNAERKLRFDANYKELLSCAESLDSSKQQLPFKYVSPNFIVDLGGFKSDVAEEIRRKVKSLSDSRDEYINTIVVRLKNNAEFKKIFLFELNKIAGATLHGYFVGRLLGDSANISKQGENLIARISTIKGSFGSVFDSASTLANADKATVVDEAIITSHCHVEPSSPKLSVQLDEVQVKKIIDVDLIGEPLSYSSILSFPAPKTEEARKIKNISWNRKIPYLIHFTRAINLPTILTHGICSIEKTREIGVCPRVNDNLRIDGCLGASSFSIAFPNSKMFYKYRSLNPSEEWVVLIVRPQVLWDKKNAFCSFNAADNRVRHRALSELSSPAAFEQMFDERDDGNSRLVQGLRSFEPTDVQAEVLVFDCVEPRLIAEIIFDDERVMKKYKNCVGDKVARMQRKNSGMFSSREYYIKSRMDA